MPRRIGDGEEKKGRNERAGRVRMAGKGEEREKVCQDSHYRLCTLCVLFQEENCGSTHLNAM